jgi:GNAT superfamily N-acetyltransferase
MDVRAVEASEVTYLAKLWHDGWQDAHAKILPAEFARLRTLESFEKRLQTGFSDAWAVGRLGTPVGFHMLKGDELNQLYVTAASRGSGVATLLIADAEARLSGNGVETAWLACAIGNERAARFYEKSGWRRAGTVINRLETPEGVFPVEVWRYEKTLGRDVKH